MCPTRFNTCCSFLPKYVGFSIYFVSFKRISGNAVLLLGYKPGKNPFATHPPPQGRESDVTIW